VLVACDIHDSLLYEQTLKSILDKAFGETGSERKTHDVKYHCPKCKHHKQKLEVNLKTGQYHCWVCNPPFKGVGIPNLVRIVSTNDALYKEAVSVYKESGGRIKTENSDIFSNTPPDTKRAQLPVGFIPLRHRQDSRSWRLCYNYAKKRRGFSELEIIRYNMGYVESGQLEERLIIPSYDANGTLNYYTARSVYDHVFLKYINSDFPKDDVVGFENFIDFKQPVNLVEGGLDAVTVGFNTIPLFGKSLSRLLKLRLVQYRPPEVRIMLDDDAFGDAMRIDGELKKLGINSRVIKMCGKDPNSIGRLASLELILNSKINIDFKSKILYNLN
jgi:hypothetical protein